MEDFVVGPLRTIPHFGHAKPKAAAVRLVAERRAEGAPCLALFTGLHGIGRFTTAVEVFHDEPPLYGNLCIELHALQADGRPTPQGELLGQLLRALGLPDAEQPISDVARADTFQRLSAHRRFLLVIRDAVNAEQVMLLIPRRAPEAVVVVTARRMIRGLLAHDFVDVLVEGLTPEESREMLKRRIGPSAVKVPSETIDEFAALCDGIPLLIRILGAQLAGRPHAAERFLQDLRVSEVAFLEMSSSDRLVLFLNATYRALEPELQVAYRRLSLLPGRSFSAEAAAVALETDKRGAGRLLDELVDASLLQFDDRADRYAFYRVVRADARRRASEADGPDVVRSTTELIVTWYLREAIPRDAVLADRWRVGAEFDRYAASGAGPVSRPAAVAWFDAEWESVVGCVRAAFEQGLHAIAWQLCVAAFKYLHLHGHVDPWLDCHELGVVSAQLCKDLPGIMQVTSQRGAAYLAVKDFERARADFEASLDAARQTGHRLGEQSACEWLGKTAAAAGDRTEALRRYDESEAVIDRFEAEIPAVQQARMRALLSLQRARAWRAGGEWARAGTAGAVAFEYFGSTDELENQAKCLVVMGEAASDGEDFARAITCYGQAATLFASDGARRGRAAALRGLGEARVAAGDRLGAVEAFRDAHELYLALGAAEADDVGARLTDLGR